MRKLKTIFSRLLKHRLSSKSDETPAYDLTSLPEFSTAYDIFEYLNFNIPDLQPIKLSLELGKQEKALEQFFQYLKIRQSPISMCNWRRREEITQTLTSQYAKSAQAVIEAANNILQHQYLLFSAYPIDTGTPISWSRSYEKGAQDTSTRWKPGRTYTAAMLLAEPQNDIHFIWQLNRHQHFFDLGKAYWYTGDEAYVEEFMREINGWIAQNPYLQSVNWVHEYEIALRGIFWLFGYAFFFCSPLVNQHFFHFFYHMLLLHGHATYHSLQTRVNSPQSRIHHVVAQASFLYMLGTLCPEYIHSKAWSTFGWEILQWKSAILTLEEILNESFISLTGSLELYCIALIVRRNNRYHIPQALIDGLASMLDRLSSFARPDATLPRFGEEHPDRLLTGMYSQTKSFDYLFTIAAFLLNNSAYLSFGKPYEEPLLWFFGTQGLQEFQQISSTPLHTRQSGLIPNSPYVVMRNGWDQDSGYCLISHGLNTSHASSQISHADLLSIELFANGQAYLIDSGPYSFDRDDEWNTYFCSAPAHNIITVDKITHIDLDEQTLKSTFDHWVSAPTFDFLSGYHNGFADLEEPVSHRRSIFYYKPGYWILSDLLTGKGQHIFDQYFHFPPFRLNVDFTTKRVDIQTAHRHHFLLMPINPREMDVAIFTGGESPDSGWISNGYKRKMKASFIKYGKQAMVPTCFHTLLYAYTHDEVLDVSGNYLQVFSQNNTPLLSHEVSAIAISVEHETHYFVLLYQQSQRIRVENLTFSGMLFFLRAQGNNILEIILHNATLLTRDDMVLFQSETPVESLTLRLTEESLHVFCTESYTFRMQLPHITEIFVNNRKAFLKREDEMIVISTSRV